MIRIFNILLLCLSIFILSSCSDCSCELQDTEIPVNSQTITSSVDLFADGCANTDGTTRYPNYNCNNSGQYTNRGKWVKIPDINPVFNSNLTVSTEGSIYFCSMGIDTYKPSSNIIITPNSNGNIVNTFEDGTQLPLEEGQPVIVTQDYDDDTVNNYVGITLGPSINPTTDCFNLSNPFNSLRQGVCRGNKLLGLSIIVGNSLITRLDYQSNDPTSSAYLYSNVQSNELSNFLTAPKDRWGLQYDISNTGQRSFAFTSPVDGIFSIKLPQSSQSGLNFGKSGKYTLKVITTPPACFVDMAQAKDTTDNRGALLLLVSSINPNDYDNAVQAFDNLNNGNEMDNYYPELIKYISNYSNVQISSNVNGLSNLVVNSTESLNPLLIKVPSYKLDTTNYFNGNLWIKVKDDYYPDNVGVYSVTVKNTYKIASQVTTFLNSLITPIVDTFNDLSHQVYQNFTSSNYLRIIKMSLMIYIVVYGIEFALGLTAISSYDLVIRAVKIGVMVQLFDVVDSWKFFNAYFFEFFKSGMDQLIGFVTGEYSKTKAGIFGFVDDIFYTFFASQTWIKIMALFPDLIGFIYLIDIVFVMVLYLMILSKTIVSYLLVVIGIAILVSLAPIFFVLILFEKTRRYFDNWVKHLVDYTLQPILMFGALYILTKIFLMYWNNLMSFDVCWGAIINFYFPLSKWTYGWIPDVTLGCIPFYNVKGGIKYIDMFMGAFVISMFTFIIKNLVSHVPEITQSITNASSAGGIAAASGKVIQQGMDAVNKGTEMVGSVAKKASNFASNATRGLNNKFGKKRAGGAEEGNLPEGIKGSIKSGSVDNKNLKSMFTSSAAGEALQSAKNMILPGSMKKQKEKDEETGKKRSGVKNALTKSMNGNKGNNDDNNGMNI